MSTFEHLEAFLGQPYQTDEWWDEKIDSAREFLAQLPNDEWQILQREYRSRPEPWQLRLAQALFAVAAGRSVPLLIDLALYARPRVAYEAICSLNALSSDEFPTQAPPELTERTIQLYRDLSAAEAPILNEFLVRLKTTP